MLMTNNPKLLKNVFTIISNINAETNFHIKEKYILFNITSKCNTNFTTIKLFKNIFSKYDYTKDISFGFSTKYLEEIMKKALEDDTIYLSFNEDYTKIKITFTNSKRKINYELGLMELIQDGFKELPEMEHTALISSDNKTILESINALIFSSDKLSEGSIMFQVSDNDFQIKESTDGGIGKTTVTLKDFNKTSFKEKLEVKFCKKMVSDMVIYALKLSDKSLYHFKADYPIKIVSISTEFEMVSVLAPRVSND